MQIANKTFLVTGGASGLGAACARGLAAAGANVAIADLNEAAGTTLAAELGESARFAATDVTSTESVAAAIEAACKASPAGELSGVIHCAGILGAARVVGRNGPHELELFERVIRVNLVGTFNVVRLAAHRMSTNAPDADGERGVIITTASVAAYEGQIGQAAYSAAKGGVAAMTLPIAREVAQFGIRVLSIAPGIFNTPMMQAAPDEVRASLAKQIPFPSRLGEPSEFALLAMQMIANPYWNGTTVRLDGAVRMQAK